MPVAQLKTVGERHLKRIKLEDDSADEFKRYLEVGGFAEAYMAFYLSIFLT
jgi:predicted AAA+ superfamily ATPase